MAHARFLPLGAALFLAVASPVAVGQEFEVHCDGSGAAASVNASQEIACRYDEQGVEVIGTDWRLGLTLRAWGRVGTLSPVPAGERHVVASRVEYRRGAIVEWYVNEERGLEQGFTLACAPTDAEGPLELVMSLAGGLEPETLAGGRAVRFSDATGKAVASYSGLAAWDADGVGLPCAVEAGGTTLTLRVDDRGARYPVVVDPWIATLEYTITRSDLSSGAFFGMAVDVEGDQAAIGAVDRAFVYVRNGTQWAEEDELVPAAFNTQAYGFSVGLSGDTAAVGAPLDNSAFVFVRFGTTWVQGAPLGPLGGRFGHDLVVLPDETVLVTAPDDTNSAGAMYVFERVLGTWLQTDKLAPGDVKQSDQFGWALDCSGDTAVVGAWHEDHMFKNDAGAAYVFVRSGTTWTEQAKLIASDSEGQAWFGSSVAISGDTIVVGAPRATQLPGFLKWMGHAYVYERVGTGWTEIAKLTPGDMVLDGNFGIEVSVEGGVAAVSTQNYPWIYLFARNGTTWSEVQKIEGTDSLGAALSQSGTTLMAGAVRALVAGVPVGAVHSFRLGSSTLSSYCTAGTSASGCRATLSATGLPSATAASGFDLLAAGVEGQKDGLYFFAANGRQANSWGSGTSFQCVVPPVRRGGLLTGSGTTGACDGSFSQDMNALWCPSCPKPSHNPGPGAVVQAQLWYRDPFNTSNQTTSLSDAIEFAVCP